MITEKEKATAAQGVAEETSYFVIDRADECIWLTDLRNQEDTEKSEASIHMVPSQAREIGCELICIADQMKTGEHRRFIGGAKT